MNESVADSAAREGTESEAPDGAVTSKGEQTRGRIVRAAVDLFSEQSFRAVSMRAIGRAAGVDPALIHHYFGTKEGLFDAVLAAATEDGDRLGGMAAVPAHEQGVELVRRAESMWGSTAGRAMIALGRRSIAGEADALVGPIARRILAKLAPILPGDEEERRLRAALVASQMAGLILVRHVLRVEPFASCSAEETAQLAGPTIQRYLTGELPARDAPPDCSRVERSEHDR